MKHVHVNALILGGGVAGFYCAKMLKKYGKSVAIIEKEKMGGAAVAWGALPAKKALDYLKKNPPEPGTEAIHIQKIMDEIETLQTQAQALFDKEKIDIFYGDGEIISAAEYKLGDLTFTFDSLVIATGTSPDSPDFLPIDGETVISHRQGVFLQKVKDKIIILGGSVEGIEFASIYAALSKKVIIIEKENELLPSFDRDLVEPLLQELDKKHVEIYTGTEITSLEKENGRISVRLEDGKILKTSQVLTTIRRKLNLPKGIERLELNVQENKIHVSERFETATKNIFAIGDCNGLLGMAHYAIAQAISTAAYISGRTIQPIDLSVVPSTVFSMPEIGGAGLMERELMKMSRPYRKGICALGHTWRGLSQNYSDGFVKVLSDVDGKIVGIWLVGNQISETASLLGILLKKQVTDEDMMTGLTIHPTIGECILEAVLNSK